MLLCPHYKEVEKCSSNLVDLAPKEKMGDPSNYSRVVVKLCSVSRLKKATFVVHKQSMSSVVEQRIALEHAKSHLRDTPHHGTIQLQQLVLENSVCQFDSY